MRTTTKTLQLGCKFDIIHAILMALMVMMTVLPTSNAFTFHHSMKKPSQGTTPIAPTKCRTQQIFLMSSITNPKARNCSARNRLWQQRHLELKEFYQNFGHTNVPQRYPTNPQLGRWVYTQRQVYKNGKLSAERIQALEDVGFCWDPLNADWEQRYLELKGFYQQFGNTNVPHRYPANPQLGVWVNTQRTFYKNGKLSAERIRALEDIDFGFDCYTDWQQRYLELKEFYQKFGHTDVPKRYNDNPQLGAWVETQRTAYKKGKLSAERIRALEEMGFHWGYINTTWEQRYLELKELYQKVGHTIVPRKYPGSKKLREWVQRQRTLYKNGELAAERMQALEDIGFRWDPHNADWEQRYLELKEFYQQHGHTDVPQRYPTNPQLGLWVETQRTAYKKGKLSADRIRAMEDIGFHWVLRSQKTVWKQRYLELMIYYQYFGHTHIPQNYPGNPQLREWVHKQRIAYKNGNLSAERIRALEDIGFDWVLGSETSEKYYVWEQGYLELKEFCQEFGHANVPRNYPDNPQLAEWVHERRVEYKNGKLTVEHTRALMDLDFKWEFRRR